MKTEIRSNLSHDGSQQEIPVALFPSIHLDARQKNCAKNAFLCCYLILKKCNIDETGDLKTSCRTRDIIIQRNLTLNIFVVYPNSLSFCLLLLSSRSYFISFLSHSLSFVFKDLLASFAISFLLSVIFCYSPHHRPFVDVFFCFFQRAS